MRYRTLLPDVLSHLSKSSMSSISCLMARISSLISEFISSIDLDIFFISFSRDNKKKPTKYAITSIPKETKSFEYNMKIPLKNKYGIYRFITTAQKVRILTNGQKEINRKG